jgi:hypothetical protein
MARAPAKQSKAEEKATIDRSRWQDSKISKAPPQLPNKEYVRKIRQIYWRAVERRLKREPTLTGAQRDVLFCIIGRLPNKEIASKPLGSMPGDGVPSESLYPLLLDLNLSKFRFDLFDFLLFR